MTAGDPAASASSPKKPAAEVAGLIRTIICDELKRLERNHDLEVDRVAGRIVCEGGDVLASEPNAYIVNVHRLRERAPRPPFAVTVLETGHILVRRGSRATDFLTTSGVFLPISHHIRAELRELAWKSNR